MNRREYTKNTASNWLAKLMCRRTDAALSAHALRCSDRSIQIIDYDINTYCKACFILLSIGVVKHFV